MICCTISLLLYVFVMHDEIDIISNKIVSIIYKIILNLFEFDSKFLIFRVDKNCRLWILPRELESPNQICLQNGINAIQLVDWNSPELNESNTNCYGNG